MDCLLDKISFYLNAKISFKIWGEKNLTVFSKWNPRWHWWEKKSQCKPKEKGVRMDFRKRKSHSRAKIWVISGKDQGQLCRQMGNGRSKNWGSPSTEGKHSKGKKTGLDDQKKKKIQLLDHCWSSMQDRDFQTEGEACLYWIEIF